MLRKATVIFDNAGGVTLQLNGEYAHHYQDGKQAGEDYRAYQEGTVLEDWEGNEPDLWTDPSIESRRNGGYAVYNQDEIAEMVETADIEDLPDHNLIDFLAVLQD